MNAGRSYVVSDNPQELDTPLISQLPQGSYTVRWTALSTTDGQATHGVIGFNIGHSSTGFTGQVILGPSTSNIFPQLNLLGILAVAWDWLVMAALALWIGMLVITGVVLAGRKYENDPDNSGGSGRRTTKDLSDNRKVERSSIVRGDREQVRTSNVENESQVGIASAGHAGLAGAVSVGDQGPIEVVSVGDQGRIGASPIPTFREKVQKQSLPLQWLCLAAIFIGEIINLILRAALLTQASNNTGIDLMTIRELIVDTTYGHLWLARMALIGVAMIFLWWTTYSTTRQTIEFSNFASARKRNEARYSFAWFILAGLILFTLALSEDVTQLIQAHASAVILDWLFLVAQCIWFGGAAYLGFVLLPILPTIEPEQHVRTLVTLLKRTTPLILVSIAILLVSGLYLAATSLSSTQQLISDPFGRALLVKIILMVLMLVLSAYALLFIGPKLRQQGMRLHVVNERLPAGRSRQTALERNERRLVVTMKSLAYLGACVLLCAAFMAFFAPPIVFPTIDNSSHGSSTGSSEANNQVSQTQHVDNLTVNLQIIPARVGSDNTVIVTIHDNKGNPVSDAQVQISINMVIMNMGVASATIKGGKPSYKAVFNNYDAFSMSGLWNVALKIQRPNQASVQVSFQMMLTG